MGDRARVIKDALWLFVLVGAVAMAFRLWYGLGATTNLSDAVPWGLWKILNMVAGVALATGGFTVGLLVYVLGMERLRPLLKPSILIAFLGYGASVFALFLDIGLPQRIWHPFVMWNPRSFLFEVAMCVATYFLITIVELAPSILERFPRWRSVIAVMHRAGQPVVIVGITLSSLHHTSLGSLFLVTPQRLHPLWYTEWLPLLFVTSAMGAGMMVTVLVTMGWACLYEPATLRRRPAPAPGHGAEGSQAEPARLGMLRPLATVAAGVLGAYLVLKVADLFRTGTWPYLLAGTWESWLYVGDLGLTAGLPLVLMSWPRVRQTAGGIAAAAGSAVLGLVLNRLSVGIFGYFRDAGRVYFPSPAEWAVSLGVIAAAGLVLLEVAESFPVFDDAWQERDAYRRAFRPSFDSLSGVWSAALGDRLARMSLIVVLAVPVAWALFYPPYRGLPPGLAEPVRPPIAMDATRAVLRLDGNRASYAVSFPLLDLRKRLGGDGSCPRCHHLSLPRDNTTPCSRCHRAMYAPTDLFDHVAHLAAVAKKEKLPGPHPGNRSCPLCHPACQPESARNAKPCLECHREDMKPSAAFQEPKDLRWAPGYVAALHRLCIPCHEREAAARGRPEFAECSHCHPRPGKPPEATRVADGAARSAS